MNETKVKRATAMDRVAFSKNLNAILYSRRLSVQNAAKLFGVSRNQMYKYLDSTNVPRLDTAIFMSRVLGMKLSSFLKKAE